MDIHYEPQTGYDEEEGVFWLTVTISNMGNYWTSPRITTVIPETPVPTEADWEEARALAHEHTRELARVLRGPEPETEPKHEHTPECLPWPCEEADDARD
jgi:hypothetical protein